jgi:predicted RNase H-like nuclease (RuvC/YqgF family)
LAIPRRNSDGSLTYVQTADELKQNEDKQKIRTLFKEFKTLTNKVVKLETEVKHLKEKIDTQG